MEKQSSVHLDGPIVYPESILPMCKAILANHLFPLTLGTSINDRTLVEESYVPLSIFDSSRDNSLCERLNSSSFSIVEKDSVHISHESAVGCETSPQVMINRSHLLVEFLTWTQHDLYNMHFALQHQYCWCLYKNSF